MSDQAEKGLDPLQKLQQLRDEIRLRIHLGSKDAQDEFEKAEKKLEEVTRRARDVGQEAKDAAQDVGAAAGALVEEVGNAFQRILKKL